MCMEEHKVMYRSLREVGGVLKTNAVERYPELVKTMQEQRDALNKEVKEMRNRARDFSINILTQDKEIEVLKKYVSTQNRWTRANLFALQKTLLTPGEAQAKARLFDAYLQGEGADAALRLASFLKKYTARIEGALEEMRILLKEMYERFPGEAAAAEVAAADAEATWGVIARTGETGGPDETPSMSTPLAAADPGEQMVKEAQPDVGMAGEEEVDPWVMDEVQLVPGGVTEVPPEVPGAIDVVPSIPAEAREVQPAGVPATESQPESRVEEKVLPAPREKREEPAPDTTDRPLSKAEPEWVMTPETPVVVPEEVILSEVDVLSGETEPLDMEPEAVTSRGGPGLREGTGGDPEKRGEPEVTSIPTREDQGSEDREAAKRTAPTLVGFEGQSLIKLTRARSI